MNIDKQNLELRQNFDILCSVIRQEKDPALEQKLSRLDQMIHKDIPAGVRQNAPPDYYMLYSDFEAEYNKFRDFILYDQLIGKNVVVLGGGFSSGKSSFLNALDHETPLPENIDPSTSVPTYVIQGEKHRVFAINIFDTKVEIENIRNIKRIAHGFGHMEDADGNLISAGTSLGHILESLFLATPRQAYPNIAFLDTPGYSKPDSAQYTSRTDEQIARQQLNTGDFILWFINANRGTIPNEDINFLKSLRPNIPKLIILTHAEEKENDLDAIKAEIKSKLTLRGLSALDICAFERNRPDDFDADTIRGWLQKWNNHKSQPQFAVNFKKLFVQCRKYYDEAIDSEQRRLETLNTAFMYGDSEDAQQILLQLKKELEHSIHHLRELRTHLEELQTAFFTELKRVGDSVHIHIPEPSEIDLLADGDPGLEETLREYRKKHHVQGDPHFVDALLDNLRDATPNYSGMEGTSTHALALYGVLSETLQNAKPNHSMKGSAQEQQILYGTLAEIFKETQSNSSKRSLLGFK